MDVVFPMGYSLLEKGQGSCPQLKGILNDVEFCVCVQTRFGEHTLWTCRSEKTLIYVPVSLREEMMNWYHSSLHHPGAERMSLTIRQYFYWYGIKKDINSAFRVFEDLEKFNLKPDADTFSSLMEILYIDTKERFPYQASMPPRYNKEDVDDVVGASQIVLGAMEEAGIQKTKHIYHEHIRLLCALGLLEDANLVLEEALSTRTPVPVASLFMIATRFADRGDFDMAHGVAALSVEASCGELPQLVNRINNIKSPKQWTKGKLRTPEPELEPESPS